MRYQCHYSCWLIDSIEHLKRWGKSATSITVYQISLLMSQIHSFIPEQSKICWRCHDSDFVEMIHNTKMSLNKTIMQHYDSHSDGNQYNVISICTLSSSNCLTILQPVQALITAVVCGVLHFTELIRNWLPTDIPSRTLKPPKKY